jgi:DNA-binding NarL/FixJ family response regulator
MIRVFVADEHAVIREGVKHILANTTDISVMGEADNVQDMMAQLAEHSCDVVLLNSTLPGEDRLPPLAVLKQTQPKLPVLMFSVQEEHGAIIGAFRAGASGYLTKTCLSEELVQAIRQVVQGGRYVSPCLTEHLILAMTNGAEQPLHACLSEREQQVLRLLVSGKRMIAIAAELGLHAKTASTYRSRILDKMHMQSTADLIQYAVRHGLKS